MGVAVTAHLGPWNEAGYLALGETTDRVELVDGMSAADPSAEQPHQHISDCLTAAVEPAADAALDHHATVLAQKHHQ